MECRYCGKIINGNSSQLKSHERYCEKNPNKLNQKKLYTFICKKCGKEYTLNLTDSEYRNKKYKQYCSRSCANSRIRTEETKMKISQTMSRLAKDEPQLFKRKPYKTYKCKECGKEYILNDKNEYKNRQYCSLDCKIKYLSNIKFGGYRKGSGRGKSGWYKGIYCDSSWELAYVIYHRDNDLDIKRCKEQRKYIFEGKEHIYIPDFITDNGIVEIKGYKTKQWEAKEKYNPDIKVLYKDEIQFYLDYVIKKYGNDYIRLYDNTNPKLNNDIYLQKFVWISNPTTKQRTMTSPEKFAMYINNGWLKGRINF